MISIKITADNHADLQRQLHALLNLSDKESVVTPYNGVDIPNTTPDTEVTSSADPETAKSPRPRRPKTNGSVNPRTPQSVESQSPEGPSDEALNLLEPPASDASFPTTSGSVDAAATAGVREQVVPTSPEDEVKDIVNKITSLCISSVTIRERVAQWRDERGMKWLRELSVTHLPDARDLLKELSP